MLVCLLPSLQEESTFSFFSESWKPFWLGKTATNVCSVLTCRTSRDVRRAFPTGMDPRRLTFHVRIKWFITIENLGKKTMSSSPPSSPASSSSGIRPLIPKMATTRNCLVMLAPPTGKFPDHASRKSRNPRKSKPLPDYDAEAFHIKLVPPDSGLNKPFLCLFPKWTNGGRTRRRRFNLHRDTTAASQHKHVEDDQQRLLDNYYVPGEWS